MIGPTRLTLGCLTIRSGPGDRHTMLPTDSKPFAGVGARSGERSTDAGTQFDSLGPVPPPPDLSPVSSAGPADWPATGPASGAITAPPGYRLLREIGRGGMAVVYEAEHLPLKRRVALKFLRGDLAETAEGYDRFRAEAEAVAQLQHPNVVQVHEVGESDGRPYLALEYIDGGSLAA